MRKLIMMLLVLAGGISTASAEELPDFWIVGDIPGTDWTTATNDWKMSTSDPNGNIYTLTVSNVTLEADKTYYFKARNTQSGWDGATSYGYNGNNQSYYVNEGKGGTYDLFFVLNRSEGKVSLIILNNLQLKGFLGSWEGINMTKVGDYTYQSTVDLSTTQESQSFKFYVDVPGHCTDQSDYWIGKDKVALDRFETNPGVLPVSDAENNYILLGNTLKGYSKFTITAKWTPCPDIRYNWNVTITPAEAREGVNKILYENTWVWPNVYVYNYTDDSNRNAAWPGEEIAMINGLYTYFYTISYDYLKFNNNSGVETPELPFTENRIYDVNGYKMVTVSAGKNGMATFSSAFPLDFLSTPNINAYIISSLTATAATLEPVDYAVPAATGLLIIGEKDASDEIPAVVNAATFDGNYLKAAVNGHVVENEGDAYILSSGKFVLSKAGSIPVGKAYLDASDIPTEARSLSLVFADDETTGIQSVDKAANENVIYNLAGQRVTAPANGLFIMNGKKIIVK